MNNQLAVPDVQKVLHPLAAPLHQAPPKPPENPLLLVRRHLRGRYHWAAMLAALFAIPGTLVGYLAIPPNYKSTGIIRVAPTKPKILYQNEENQMIPMFDSFVSAQATLINSLRVLELANENPKLRSAGWPVGQEGVRQLRKTVVANARRGSEIILVEGTDTNPSHAQLAVNAVLDAYEAIQEELNGTGFENRESTLVQRERELSNELNNTRQEIWRLGEERGTDDLASIHAAKLASILRLESSIAEFDLKIAEAKRAPVTEAPAEPAAQERNLQVLASRDPTLRALLADQERVQLEYDTNLTKLTPAHRTMVKLKQNLDGLATRIAARAAIVEQMPQGPTGIVSRAPTLAELQAARDELAALHRSGLDELRAIGRTRNSIATLNERVARLQRDWEETRTRLEQIRVERQGIDTGRIAIAQRGDLPGSPFKDRRIPLAAFGLLAGCGLGAGCVWLFGFLKNSYRYVDELEPLGVSSPLLGIIPDLSTNDPMQEEQAALSVHHIRNSLQLQTQAHHGEAGKVFTVTSASAGDGKTHLALALGLSFARAGSRTLLVDADLISRALSRQLNLDGAHGLSETIGQANLNGEVHLTRTNLWTIPVGAAPEFRPEQLSSTDLKHVLEIARQSFDAIIIDSGPIMGSLEANVAASLSDRVLMVVSRGQNPKLVQAALRKIQNLGAACGGLVFNRAMPRDFSQSMSGLSTSFRTVNAVPAEPGRADLVRFMESPATASQTSP